jgi:hypothetical protein
MIVQRDELFSLMGLDDAFASGTVRMLETPDGRRRATLRWDDDEITADVSDAIEGESGDTLVTIAGTYLADEDSFEVTAEDLRHEASDPRDPRGVASAFHFLTRGMEVVA